MQEDVDHRRYVGPAQEFDVLGASQFALLCALGLREHGRVADLGSGSLRAGRFLIQYLAPGRYYGIEPNRWLVDAALEQEVPSGIRELKAPQFFDFDDFDLSRATTEFDFVLANSVFSHTYPDLFTQALRGVGGALAPGGVVAMTFCRRARFVPLSGTREPSAGSGWLYPGTVSYTWAEVRQMLSTAGLEGAMIPWQHPSQRWMVAARERSTVRASVSRASRGFARPPAYQRYAHHAVTAVKRLTR